MNVDAMASGVQLENSEAPEITKQPRLGGRIAQPVPTGINVIAIKLRIGKSESPKIQSADALQSGCIALDGSTAANTTHGKRPSGKDAPMPRVPHEKGANKNPWLLKRLQRHGP
jgi:hypothetical protein